MSAPRLFRSYVLPLAALFLVPSAGLFAQQSLPECVRPEFSAAPRIGDLDASASLRLSLTLPLRDPAGADRLMDLLYDPSSPQYRHFIGPDEFADRFGPSEADYQALIAFARAHGLRVTATHHNRMVLEVRGSAAGVERAFHVRLGRRLRADGSLFYAPDGVPSVDLDLPGLGVHGLDDFLRWRRNARRHAAGSPPGRAAGGQNGSGPQGAYQGYDFRDAYAPGVTWEGAGQRVGLIEFGGYYAEDISAYASSSNPALPSDFQVSPVLVGGYNGNPMDNGDSASGSADDNSEVSLDIELAMAMAPQAVIVPFEADINADFDTVLAAAADDTACAQISCSWFGGTMGADAASDLIELADQGQAFFQAAGDDGAWSYDSNGENSAGPVPLPQSLTQCVTVVGGTELLTNAASHGNPLSYASESTWNDYQGTCADLTATSCSDCGGGASGGGICDVNVDNSDFESDALGIPSWQAGVSMSSNGGSSSFRNIPDVSAVGEDFQTVYCGGCSAQADGGTAGEVSVAFDGTSGATPLWAAFWALANQQAASASVGPLGFANPYLYTIGKGANYTADFHDIADGSNNGIFSTQGDVGQACSTVYFTAVTGYDLCTGWGSPQGQSMINALAWTLASPTPTATYTASPTITPTPSITQTFTASPTLSPSSTVTPTLTITPTFTASPTPAYLSSGSLGRVVLVPDPVRDGGPATLYFTQEPASSRWWVYTLTGRLALTASITGVGPHQVSTQSLASGIYFARVKVEYADGQSQSLLFKFAVLR